MVRLNSLVEIIRNFEMNLKKTRILLILMTVTISNAWAYVDGGTGMLLIQGLLALIGAIIFFIKNPINTIRNWLKRFRK